jgi:hypothetical protein
VLVRIVRSTGVVVAMGADRDSILKGVLHFMTIVIYFISIPLPYFLT